MANNGYPQFARGKFNHFNKNLAVVDYFIRANKSLEDYERATKLYDASVAEYSCSNSAMYEILVTKLTALTTVGPGTATDPAAAFSAVDNGLKRLRRATRQTCDELSAKREIREVLMNILPLFCTFDKEGLTKVAEPLLTEGKQLTANKNKLSGSKGAAKVKYTDAIKVFSHIYANPEYLDHMPTHLQAEAAFQDAKEFADTWKYRARLFVQPVTLAGTAIRTLPAANKKLWSNAYNKLGLGDLKHSDVYTPFAYKESEFVSA